MTDVLTEKGLQMFKKYLDRSGMDHKDYQYEGVKWCLNNELRLDPPCKVRGGFIADEMGLGKTILMIGLFFANFLPKTLIVLPPVLIDQWYAQILKTTGHKALIYHGLAKKKITMFDLDKAKIVITSYGAITLTKERLTKERLTKEREETDVTLLHKVNWSRIVYDEAHHLRNKETCLYKSAKLLQSRVRWLVSGTPVQNKKADFYNLCSILNLPASFYTNSENLKEFGHDFILKRTKKQVGILLPELVLEKNMVGWGSQSELDISEEIHSGLDFSNVSSNKSKKLLSLFQDVCHPRALPMYLTLKARQSCIFPKLMTGSLDGFSQKGMFEDYDSYKDGFDHSSKLDSVVETILENKGNGCGKLIFCHFRQEIDEIAMRLRKGGMANVATMDGRTSGGKRTDMLNDADNEALILQIQTGCEGLNLQENYSEIYFVSPHWNPAVEDQAIARCHRIGQKKRVYVKRFEMGNFVKDADQQMETICVDNYANSVQEAKRLIAKKCIDDALCV